MGPGNQDLEDQKALPPKCSSQGDPTLPFPCFLKLLFIGHSLRAVHYAQHSSWMGSFYGHNSSAGRYHCYSHFIDKHTEAWRGEITCVELVSHRAGSDLRFLTRVFGGRPLEVGSIFPGLLTRAAWGKGVVRPQPCEVSADGEEVRTREKHSHWSKGQGRQDHQTGPIEYKEGGQLHRTQPVVSRGALPKRGQGGGGGA